VGVKVAEALRAAAERLAATSDTARLDAEYLMAHALGTSRSDMLLTRQRDAVPAGFEALITRRLAQEPLAYITGEQEFFGRSLTVTPDVLIPRSDSEQVVEAALAAMPDGARVLDCGTGSGALLLTLLAERPQVSGVGIDASHSALAVAAANAARLGVAGRARLLHADWHEAGWASDLGLFDLVIANPPYVETAAALDPSVRDYEPAAALYAGKDGLDDYRVLIPQLSSLLLPGGVAVLEIGATQTQAVAEVAAECGAESELRQDLAGRPRAMILRFGLGKARIRG
jgi:release factor glutamine methyltransferase